MSDYTALIRAKLLSTDATGRTIQQQINDIVKTAQANIKVNVAGVMPIILSSFSTTLSSFNFLGFFNILIFL